MKWNNVDGFEGIVVDNFDYFSTVRRRIGQQWEGTTVMKDNAQQCHEESKAKL